MTTTEERLAQDFGVTTGVATPRRLSEETRRLAARALAGRWGREMAEADFAVPDEKMDGLSDAMRHARAVMCIAENAPLRIDPHERIVGAATLLEATWHQVPAVRIPSTSHTTLGFGRVLTEGYAGLRHRIDERLTRRDLTEQQRDYLAAMRLCLDAAGVWHARYVRELKSLLAEAPEDKAVAHRQRLEALRNVPENPPRTFHEAVQSLWMMWTFQRLCGNWSGLGRIDRILGSYLEADLAAGRITLNDARELVAHFWLKGCEWVGAQQPGARGGSGDAQFYQNVVLAGIDADGNNITNEVTYLVFDVIEELHISDYPVAVRVGPGAPPRLLRRIAEVQRLGGGIVSIYNEPLVLEALHRFGYSPEETWDFANDGCWEVILPGKTCFGYAPFDALQVFEQAIGLADGSDVPEAADFESLYACFRDRLAKHLEAFHDDADQRFSRRGPAPLVSLFVEDCIERARDYGDQGPKYTVLAPHAGGVPDVANNLLAIRRLIYEEERFALGEFVEILRRDWEGHEKLRTEIANQLVLYGNDDAEADALFARVVADFSDLAMRVRERNGVLRPPGLSTFGREIGWREQRHATAFGRRQGELLATNASPTPGSDFRGPTAVIQSFCAMDCRKLPNGVPLELKMMPATLRGEAGVAALEGLMRAFLCLGGFYLHVDVVDTSVLKDAQAHPERYPNLAVRISGWSARFVALSKVWQDMIIQRTQQRI